MKNLKLHIQYTYKYFKSHALNNIRRDLTVDERGCLVPLKHHGKDPRVNSVMLGIMRDQLMEGANMFVDIERVNLLKSMLK